MHSDSLKSTYKKKGCRRISKWRKELGINVNIEQATLPAELCASRDKSFRIIIDKTISIDTLKASGKSAPQIASDLRQHIYTLRDPESI